MAREIVYYKLNVPYPVGVRANVLDSRGQLLARGGQPWVAVDKEFIRDFLIANKYAIKQGLIIETPEPSIDVETENALTDADISELLKNYMRLKVTLPKIDSISTVGRIYAAAKEEEKSEKVVKLIRNRLNELQEDFDEPLSPGEMGGIS